MGLTMDMYSFTSTPSLAMDRQIKNLCYSYVKYSRAVLEGVNQISSPSFLTTFVAKGIKTGLLKETHIFRLLVSSFW